RRMTHASAPAPSPQVVSTKSARPSPSTSPAGASRARETIEAEPQGFASSACHGAVTGMGGLDGGGMRKTGVVGACDGLRVVPPHATRFDATALTKNGVQLIDTSQRTTADRDRTASCPAASSAPSPRACLHRVLRPGRDVLLPAREMSFSRGSVKNSFNGHRVVLQRPPGCSSTATRLFFKEE